jgi:hypothetical protein
MEDSLCQAKYDPTYGLINVYVNEGNRSRLGRCQPGLQLDGAGGRSIVGLFLACLAGPLRCWDVVWIDAGFCDTDTTVETAYG